MAAGDTILTSTPKRPRSPTRRQTDTDLKRLKGVAYTVCGTAGLDVAGYAIPYLASWSEAASIDTIEQAARLIDRLARRVETAVEVTGEAGEEADLVAEPATVKPVEEQLVGVGQPVAVTQLA